MLDEMFTSTNPAVPDPFMYENDAALGVAVRAVEATICKVTAKIASLYGVFTR